MFRSASLLVLMATAIPVVGQTTGKPKCELELVSMIRSGETQGNNDIQVVYAVTPIKKKDYPPVLSMRIGYAVNDQGPITFLDIQHHEPQQVRMTIYDKSLPEKNPKLYERIRSELDLDKYEDVMFLLFQFRDISDVPIQKVAITYGLWEKNDLEQRIEQTFSQEFQAR